MAPGHMAQGTVFGLALAPLAPHPAGLLVSTALFVGTSGLIGALVPDLDHRKSRLTHALPPVTWILMFILVRVSKATYMATRTKRDHPGTDGHRALTHTPVFAVVLGTGVFLALNGTALHRYALLLALGITVGCFAHLFGDSLTNSGVPWFWPLKLNGRRWGHYGIPKWMRFETGGGTNKRALTWAAKGEHIVTLLSMALCVAVPIGYAWMGWGV